MIKELPIEKSAQVRHQRRSKTGKVFEAGTGAKKDASNHTCQVCGKSSSGGYLNPDKEFICHKCAEKVEHEPYGRTCEFCGADTFTESHKANCPTKRS
jgi:hypothetical protein